MKKTVFSIIKYSLTLFQFACFYIYFFDITGDYLSSRLNSLSDTVAIIYITVLLITFNCYLCAFLYALSLNKQKTIIVVSFLCCLFVVLGVMVKKATVFIAYSAPISIMLIMGMVYFIEWISLKISNVFN